MGACELYIQMQLVSMLSGSAGEHGWMKESHWYGNSPPKVLWVALSSSSTITKWYAYGELNTLRMVYKTTVHNRRTLGAWLVVFVDGFMSSTRNWFLYSLNGTVFIESCPVISYGESRRGRSYFHGLKDHCISPNACNPYSSYSYIFVNRASFVAHASIVEGIFIYQYLFFPPCQSSWQACDTL